MDATTETKGIDGIKEVGVGEDQYRSHIKKLIENTIKGVVEQEIQKASQELVEEQRNVIRQIVDEYKTTLRQIVDEEKKSIWEKKAEEFRKSILNLGQ